MINERIVKNYELSLNQKFNAVCFDIDGTLTEKNSKKIDIRAIEMISDLLKRKVPVVFITGRGETGLNDLKDDIYLPLKNNFNISDNEFKRMYILTNDGARLFYTSKDSDTIFDSNVYISTKEELNELKEFGDNIISQLDSKLLNNICDITYSEDFKNKTIINIRIVFKDNNEKLINEMFDIIQDVISKLDLKSIYTTRGIYRDKNVIQVGTTTKDKAIEKAEQIIGVPQNSMIRVGDCGDVRGNDYSMLNCEQGYSVDKTSGDINSCFPVFDNDGKILKGIDATLFLIKKAKILPTVCLERATKSDYRHEYANVEKNIILGRNNHLKNFNQIINNNFELIDGIDGLFDASSGAIKIPMYEWELIPDNALKRLWSRHEDEKLLYSMRDDNNYLLRGSKTYYYFLANRESNNGKDVTTKEHIIEWYYNYLVFIKESYSAINEMDNLDDTANKKMLLGVLDNIRNILLIIINHKLYSEYFNQNVLLNLNKNNDFNSLYKILYVIEKNMSDLCFSKSYDISKEKFLNMLQMSYVEVNKEFVIIKDKLEDKDYSKEYRAYREIDNFAENYITLALNNDKINIKDFSVCGLSYGGIELPILYKVLNDSINDVLVLKYNKQVSGYTNKQLIELRKFNINEYGGIIGTADVTTKNMILLDDNTLTGKTLQLAINSLYDYNFNVTNISIVRYPSVNRIDQMFMDNHGAVDYHLFFDYITGLCFNSPYSWRDENDLNKYEDSLGVFDLNRKKIIECLIKNHDYKDSSEVGEYRRRIKK